MNLRDHKFHPDYNKTDNDIAEDFYLPAMRSSCQYDRISGYFGSTVYIIAWSALQQFVDNGGRMRIICSPVISDADKDAMTEGFSAQNNKIIQESMARELQEMFADEDLEKPARVLACLVAEKILDIRIAVPESGMEPDLERLFHDKMGIFTDSDGNSVGFRGSMNETYKGLSEDGNLESIDVFPSWEDARDSVRVQSAIQYFDRLWNGTEPNVMVYHFPEAVKKDLINRSNGYDWHTLTKEISTTVTLNKRWAPDKHHFARIPRRHQVQALENWVKNGRRGILKHATGSGKTFTAICAIRDAMDRGKKILVLVPSRILLYQWKNEIAESMKDIDVYFLPCGDGNNLWKKDHTLQRWTSRGNLNCVVIAIMGTACTEEFLSQVSGKNLLLIADEVHQVGSPERRKILRIEADERLGLSATPERYGDPEGTQALLTYFGGIVPPEFTLQDAVKSGVLTPYFYYPLPVHLSRDEQDSWNRLTVVINRMIAVNGEKGESAASIIRKNPSIKRKLIERARIVKKAEAKVPLAIDVIKKNYSNGQRWIIYCEDRNQLSDVLRILLKDGYNAYEYYSDMEGDKQQTLEYFTQFGGILVSIKCLDEGVDIPSVTHALILASSKNPREFIQRRGRILRRYPGKACSFLYDAVVVPEMTMDEKDKSISILRSEFARAIQFGRWASNPTCISQLKCIAIDCGIDYTKFEREGLEDDNETEP